MVTYVAHSTGLAAQVIRELEAQGIDDYSFSGPTIEDVFLQVAEEVRAESEREPVSTPQDSQILETPSSSEKVNGLEGSEKKGLELLSGQRIGHLRQTGVLFLKRCTIFEGKLVPLRSCLPNSHRRRWPRVALCQTSKATGMRAWRTRIPRDRGRYLWI